MGHDSQNGSEQRRKDLFSKDERAGFRKRDDASTLTPPLVKEQKQQTHPAPGQAQRSSIGFRRDTQPGPVQPTERTSNRLDPRSVTLVWLGIGLVVAYIATLILPNYLFNVNNHDLSPAWFFEILGRNVNNLATFISGGGAYGGIDFVIIRLAIIALAGAALSISGAAFQGSLQNQLASPSTLGVMSGAQFGGVLYLMLLTAGVISTGTVTGNTLLEQSASMYEGMNIFEYIWSVFEQGFFSLAGSTIVVTIVLGVSWLAGHGRSSRVAMVVTGQVVASLVSSFVVLVRIYVQQYGSGAQIDALRSVMAGNFDATFTLPALVVVGVPLLICMGIVFSLRNRLNLLAFDETEARSMGIRTGALKVALVACCTIMTAVVVAFCGTVGYVGFLIPHLARRIIGPDFKYLIPASALLGAIFLLVVYYLYMCFSIPGGSMSTVTTILGVVAFVVVVFQQRRSGYASW